ncbi:hypothetical protein GCM10011578_041890 [Streptomyces fuscichromogenes]|uniref:Uncharacterized protein n=1 Tax=Streptomyces fuscichromogenes TaxID=1324013 RepID=A0A917XE99_9ACTN|nr:hypothetical protein GCM10011578_041890 [Streptomyces fuscichromogenes]
MGGAPGQVGDGSLTTLTDRDSGRDGTGGVCFKDNRHGPAGNRFGARVDGCVSAGRRNRGG